MISSNFDNKVYIMVHREKLSYKKSFVNKIKVFGLKFKNLHFAESLKYYKSVFFFLRWLTKSRSTFYKFVR